MNKKFVYQVGNNQKVKRRLGIRKKAILCCFVFYLDIFRRDEVKRADLGRRS